MIEIRTLNKRQLDEFVHSEGFKTLPFLPISFHRALSHTLNPRAGENDVLLLLAYEANMLVGYLGVLADRLYYDENRFETCGWLSCMWIDENHRGKKIAQKLLEKCFETWQHKILVTEFTVAAKGLYDKTGVFEDLQVKTGIRLYVRSDLHKLLPPKRPVFEKMKPLLKAFDRSFNLIFDLRFLFVKRRKFNIEIIKGIDDETSEFMKLRQEGQIFRRGAEDINWIIGNPWILAGEEDEASRKYHFSYVDRSFDFYPVKVRDKENRMIAFLLFSKRDRTLKLPYAYISEGHTDEIAALIEAYIIKWRINTFTCFHPELVAIFRQNDTIALFKKEVRRHYIISKDLKALLKQADKAVIQDGDADAAFT